MTVQPAGSDAPEALLFTPGPRVGWMFTDRRARISPYAEPQPDRAQISSHLMERRAKAERSYRFAMWWVLRPFLPLALILYALSVFIRDVNHHAHTGGLAVIAVVLAIAGICYPAWCYTRVALARDTDPQRLHQAASDGWQHRAIQHEQDELTRLADIPEWESVTAAGPRVDVFGGTLVGWQGLLATYGTSVLPERPLLVADFTGQLASAQLTDLAQRIDPASRLHLLPEGLGESGILTGLTPAQLATALAEAIHADVPGGARADRAIDTRVAEQLAAALNNAVTPIRLAAAVQAALGQPVPPGVLTAEETAWIGGGLFQETYRAQVAPSLVRLEAFTTDLARHAGAIPDRRPRPAWYTCLALDPATHGARTELLAALTVQWLTTRVTASKATTPAVVIAGADTLTGTHLEALDRACEQRRVPLTLLFRRLRDDATTLVGGAPVTGFMRLGNHHEAEQAAAFIGRTHKFVLSDWTVTRGGEEGSTRTSEHGQGTSHSRGWSSNRGWANDGYSQTRDYGRSEECSQSDTWSRAANWSHAQNTQRVYEFAVEPTVLQNLPDYALLLPRRTPGATQVQAVECDPAIVAMTQPHTAIPDGADPPQPAIAPGQNDEADFTKPDEQPTWPDVDDRPMWPPSASDWRPGKQPR